MMGPLLVHLVLQVVLLFDALGWEVRMPQFIHGLKDSCLVIPCTFSYDSYPPENPNRIVWYQWASKGYPLVYDPLYPDYVIDEFRGDTDLYRNSDRECSLLIRNLQDYHEDKVYAWIDPENVGWRTYAFYDVTSTIYVDESPKSPYISISGGERMGEWMTVTCSTSHTCPYSTPTIELNGIEGYDGTNDYCNTDGQCTSTRTRTSVVKAEWMTIRCFVRHYGGITASARKDKSAKCVYQQMKIEPELADVTEGIAKIFTCRVYHSCQRETPTITWNYRNMQVSTKSEILSGVNRVTYSDITFLSTNEDHGKKLICTASFSGGNTEAYIVFRVQRRLLTDVLGWEVKIPKEIRGLRGSCLVIPCSFSYTSDPPKNPRRVVWYQWNSKGQPLVYDPSNANNVIEKFRGKTDLYGSSTWDCSLLIKTLEQSHNGETLYTRIDPENVAWNKYKYYDATSTILVDASPQLPNITVYGGEIIGETITVVCSTSHTCPYNKPTITVSGVEGTDDIKDELIKDGLWKITLTHKGVVKTESLTVECLATHHGGIKATARAVKTAKCVHHNISIEPELADVTEGVAQIFTCRVYHSCQKETPTITWNYENMQVSTMSGFNRVTYSNITFLSAIEDHGKKLICTAKISGRDIETSVVLHVQKYIKPDPVVNETFFQYVADVTPKITALTRSCVVIPCSFQVGDENVTGLWVRWVTKKGDYMFHTSQLKVLDNFKDRTKLLGIPEEQNCTLEINDVQNHDNGPFCFEAETENEKYSFNNSCVFIIMRATPNKPVMSSLPEDIEPGTQVTVKCSVNHTCSSHPPEITWNVPTSRETVSHSPMGGGVWETESTVTFSPTGYEDKDNIVCSVKFWGDKTHETAAFLSVKRFQEFRSETIGLYAIAPSLVFILICMLAGVFIHKSRHRQPPRQMQGLHTHFEQRSSWNRFSSRLSMSYRREALTGGGNTSDIRNTGNDPKRPPKPEKRHQSPRSNANLRVEYKANNTCAVSGNKPFSKPHMPSPKRDKSPRSNANLRAERKANKTCPQESGNKPFSKPYMPSPKRVKKTCAVSGNKPFSKPYMPSPKSEPKYDHNADFTNIYGNVR